REPAVDRVVDEFVINLNQTNSDSDFLETEDEDSEGEESSRILGVESVGDSIVYENHSDKTFASIDNLVKAVKKIQLTRTILETCNKNKLIASNTRLKALKHKDESDNHELRENTEALNKREALIYQHVQRR
ncbi:unnamed protein product, partial [Acanthoscelides obtectus]